MEDSWSASGEEFPRLGEVFDFLRLLWAVDHGIHAMSKRMESALRITGPQRLALRIIGRFPRIPAGTLASLLRVHPGTLTGVLQRLERRGLLARRLDPRDGRRVLLGLTARGRTLDVPARGTIEAAVERALSGLPRLKLAAARDVLEVLARALEEEMRSGGARAAPAGGSRKGGPLRQHGPAQQAWPNAKDPEAEKRVGELSRVAGRALRRQRRTGSTDPQP